MRGMRNPLIYSSSAFITVSLHAWWKDQRLHGYLWTLLSLTSILYHSILPFQTRISHHTINVIKFLDKTAIYMVILSGTDLLIQAQRLIPALIAVWMFLASCGTWHMECKQKRILWYELHFLLHMFSLLGHHALLMAL